MLNIDNDSLAEAEFWIKKAKDNLNKTIGVFKECGADGWVKKFERNLTEL